ncbi:MAG: hypothetical protein JWQ66_3711 [Mucilaginibacter sp.]|nr:hypothetical protein [Mucilaginibacter sp.]
MELKLSEFLNRLFTEGVVTVPRQLLPVEEADLREAVRLIRQFYESDWVEMAYVAPVLDEAAALWAAQYFFRAVQFVLLRDLVEDQMAIHLQPYGGEVDAGAVYSVDLVFRYLGPLFKLSSGLAPYDPLVERLRATAAAWPFSSVGLGVDVGTDDLVSLEVIFSHPSLKYAYVDRVILLRDAGRINDNVKVAAALQEVLGLHQKILWPGLELQPLPNELI